VCAAAGARRMGSRVKIPTENSTMAKQRREVKRAMDDSLSAEAEYVGCVVYAGEDGVVAADAARISVDGRKGPHRDGFVALFDLDVRIGGKVSES
jgi:hypothetical protein